MQYIFISGEGGMQLWPGWSSVSQYILTALISHGVFVKEVLSHAALRGSHAAQVGDPVSQLFDRFDLLIQKMCFNEVTQLWGKKDRMFNLIGLSCPPNVDDAAGCCGHYWSAAYMRIIVFSRHFLQVQQGLVYTFLQLQATLQSL